MPNIQDQLFDKNLRGSEASGSSQKLCDAEIKSLQAAELMLVIGKKRCWKWRRWEAVDWDWFSSDAGDV